MYKEKATEIHYVVFKEELEMSRGDDCILVCCESMYVVRVFGSLFGR